MPTKPPRELTVEAEAANGDTFRLEPKSRNPAKRFNGLNFSTQRGDGFATGGYNVNRRILRDYPDLNLLDTHRYISRAGNVVYEGRYHSDSRPSDPQQQIQVNLVGWMNYLKRKINPLIVDRRLGGWTDPSIERRAKMMASGFAYRAETSTGRQDAGSLPPGILFNFSQFGTGSGELAEVWFYASGEDIGELRFDLKPIGGATDATWTDIAILSTNDIATVFDSSIDYHQAEALGQSLKAAAAGGRKYAAFVSAYGGAWAGEANIAHAWLQPAVIGTHGLGPEPEVGEIIRYVLETYFDKVAWAGQSNSYPVKQAAWQDSPTPGYDVIQQLNDLVLWETNMWEGPALYFEPADLTEYDWIIDTSEPGVKVNFEGDSIESFANGIMVTYTDLKTGSKRLLHPEDHEELRDEDDANPANLHNEPLYTDDEVPSPCFEAEALQWGRARLAENNRPKRPGSYTISGGYIRDVAKHWHCDWEVRNSQTLGIIDHPSDAPRLITATGWDEAGGLNITVDAPPKTLDAIAARELRAREAANLT